MKIDLVPGLERMTGLVLTICFFLALGCKQDTSKDVTVQGTVTVGSTPLSEGLITFAPEEGTVGAKVSAPIEAGNFSIPASDGLHPGLYRVEIFGLPPGVKAMMNNEPISHKSDVGYREIAAKYNVDSQVTTTLQIGENRFDSQVEYQ